MPATTATMPAVMVKVKSLLNICYPFLGYRSRTNRSVKVLDLVQFGGPILTVGRTIFEMWLGAP